MRLKEEKGMTLLNLSFVILALLAIAAIAVTMIIDELNYDPEPVQTVIEEKTEPPKEEHKILKPIDNNTINDLLDNN